MAENILQSEILTEFVYPFLLIFFIIFAVLEKTKVFGSDKKQINALVAFVVGLIFIGAVFPKMVVGNLVLFLAVSVVIVFVILLLWGFVTGGEAKFDSPALKIIVGIVVLVAVAIAVFLITGMWDTVSNFLFRGGQAKEVWTNVIFIVLIVIALITVLAGSKK